MVPDYTLPDYPIGYMGFMEAIRIIEEGTNCLEEWKRAWVYMIDTGHCWNLQGSLFGSPAAQLIENGDYHTWREELLSIDNQKTQSYLFKLVVNDELDSVLEEQ